ncbi:MAG: hypothetical protein J2P37_31825 [Ktedonobacteraceae bacterium]|nr:hypothetical protein [Ktedonobacteraceae bacterium]
MLSPIRSRPFIVGLAGGVFGGILLLMEATQVIGLLLLVAGGIGMLIPIVRAVWSMTFPTGPPSPPPNPRYNGHIEGAPKPTGAPWLPWTSRDDVGR